MINYLIKSFSKYLITILLKHKSWIDSLFNWLFSIFSFQCPHCVSAPGLLSSCDSVECSPGQQRLQYICSGAPETTQQPLTVWVATQLYSRIEEATKTTPQEVTILRKAWNHQHHIASGSGRGKTNASATPPQSRPMKNSRLFTYANASHVLFFDGFSYWPMICAFRPCTHWVASAVALDW